MAGNACGSQGLQVNGCAATQSEFESVVLQESASGASLSSISASCSLFYAWICEVGLKHYVFASLHCVKD
eukprot:860368-Rhodomonas_salina.1